MVFTRHGEVSLQGEGGEKVESRDDAEVSKQAMGETGRQTTHCERVLLDCLRCLQRGRRSVVGRRGKRSWPSNISHRLTASSITFLVFFTSAAAARSLWPQPSTKHAKEPRGLPEE